jgi:hypothetical protein
MTVGRAPAQFNRGRLKQNRESPFRSVSRGTITEARRILFHVERHRFLSSICASAGSPFPSRLKSNSISPSRSSGQRQV